MKPVLSPIYEDLCGASPIGTLEQSTLVADRHTSGARAHPAADTKIFPSLIYRAIFVFHKFIDVPY
jgi:hypothetical protein